MTGFIHKEAFALMWYGCEVCDHNERIWNSRDGVTPFGTTCPSCGNIMRHYDWLRDERAPDHQLLPGQKYWRDGTPEEAIALIDRRAQKFAAQGHVIPEDVLTSMKAEVGDDEGEFRKGWPFLAVAPPSAHNPYGVGGVKETDATVVALLRRHVITQLPDARGFYCSECHHRWGDAKGNYLKHENHSCECVFTQLQGKQS